MIRLLLRCFDLLAPLIRLAGADYAQFRAILEIKLILDGRRRNPMNPGREDKKPRNQFAGSLLIYVFVGLMMWFVIKGSSPMVGMTIFNAYVMLMIAMSLIADFSSVLLDTTDNAILQPRPVDGRTVLLARAAHIVTYLSLLSLSLSLVVLIGGAIKIHPLFPVVYLGTLCCSIALVISLANVLYLLAMRLTAPERLRDIITYFQIAVAVVVVGGYQLMPRLMDMNALADVRIDDRTWIYFFPPTWMAGPIDLLAGHMGRPQLILTALSIAMPAACLVFVLKVVAPRFNRMLLDADATPEDTRRQGAAGAARGSSIADRLAGVLSRSDAERAVFGLIWRLCGRDRPFKMRTYPAMAFPVIFSLAFMLGGSRDMLEALRNLPNTDKHLFLLYMATAIVPNVLLQLRFGEKYEAAWMYYALPVAAPGEILSAAYKAVMLRFIVPGFLAISLLVLAFWGFSSMPDIGLAFCAMLFISGLEAVLLARALPFSMPFGAMEMSGRFARSMLLMLVPAVIGLLHWGLLVFVPIAMLPLAALLLGGALLLGRSYRRTEWAQLRIEGL